MHLLDVGHALPVARVAHVQPRDAQVAEHDTEQLNRQRVPEITLEILRYNVAEDIPRNEPRDDA